MPTQNGPSLLLALAILAFHAGCAPLEPAPQTRPLTTWYQGDRYHWNARLVRGEVYKRIALKLPPEQATATGQLALRDVVPLDCEAGTENPRITYILAHADDASIHRYLGFPGIKALDLYYSSLTPGGLARLRTAQVSSLTLPAGGLSTEDVRQLIASPSSLPRLRHLEIVAESESLTEDALLALNERKRGFNSLQFSGARVTDRWLQMLSQRRSLRGLRLYETSVSDSGLAGLCTDVPWLTHLAICYSNRITAEGVSKLPRSIRELHLVGRIVTDKWLMAVADSDVERLVIESRNVSADGIAALSRMTRLRTLVIMGTRDPSAVDAAIAWQRAMPDQRRLFLDADAYLGGWVEGLEAQWVQLRGYHPEMFP